MQNSSPSLKIKGSDAFVSPFEIYFLGYPNEPLLQDFIFESMLMFNFARNERYRNRPPALFVVGMDLIKATFASKHISRLPNGITILSTSLMPEAIIESIYHEVVYRRPACIFLSGFNNIDFSKQSVADRKSDIESFLHQLRKIQKQISMPILISTKINEERVTCVPSLEFKDVEFAVSTDRNYTVSTADGVFKLYHVLRNSETPVTCLYKENLTSRNIQNTE
jgi:hypothetical protein